MKNDLFPTRLREARVAKGYSQTDLAKMADLAPGQVNRYEAGKNFPRPHVIGRLAGALGVHPEWLHLGEGPRETGSVTAYGKELDVTTRRPAHGGMDIEIALDDELHGLFSQLAEAEGLALSDFLKKALLERAEARKQQRLESGINLDELAEKVKALIAADLRKPSK